MIRTKIDQKPADGLCAIDIVIKEGVTEDKASTREITSAAFILLEGCVKSDKNSGGVSARLGKRPSLKLKITIRYQPRFKTLSVMSRQQASAWSQDRIEQPTQESQLHD